MVSATPAIGQVTPAQAEATTPAEAKVEADAATATSAVDAPPAEDRAGGGDIVDRIAHPASEHDLLAAPITSVTSQDIRAQAAGNVEDVLNRLLAVAPDSRQTYR
ncbi:hypothetical protein QP185_16660 [Sphingomonas aerolata]|uniref:hypothetical protein n=1 Tax=Sphingomonas aerolata TaxID=185951 RepID=UPI002FE19978